MANYVGKAPLTLVRANGAMAYVYAGEPVPQGVDPDDLKRLVDEEFFVKAADPEDPPPIEDPIAGHPFAPPLVDQFGVASAAASVPSGESADGGDDRPPKTANKDIWLEYRGLADLPDEQQKELTKDQLQDDAYMASYQRPAPTA